MEKQNETIKNFSDEVIKAEYERRFMKEPCAVCKNYCDENSDWGRIDDVMSNDIVCSDKIYITKYCPNCGRKIRGA